MLHLRDESVPSLVRSRRNRESIRLRASTREGHPFRIGADQGRHLHTRRLDGVTRRPALGMDRRRIAMDGERRGECLVDLVAKRRRGVVIEIGTLVHALTKLAAGRRRLTLARAPVARAMKPGRSLRRSKCPAIRERPCLEQF